MYILTYVILYIACQPHLHMRCIETQAYIVVVLFTYSIEMVDRWLVHALLLCTFYDDFSCFHFHQQSTAIEIGFTLPRIYHIEEFRSFETLINKSCESEQTFTLQIEVSTLLSGAGQRATRGEDFETGAHIGVNDAVIIRQMVPSQNIISFSYSILGDNTPENQEVFQLSITPAINSPPFECSVTNGCYPQIEIVVIDDDGGL